MEWLTGLFAGIGLSATCGFRIFVPLLGMSIASRAGQLELAHGFEWIASYPAIIAFSAATAVEIGGYYIPWLDNLLDSIATPAAVAAGTIVTASMVGDMSPFMRWTLAVIAGGGAAGMIQGGSVMLRGASTATTGGAANPAVSTGELFAAITGTLLSILLPLIAMAVIAGIAFVVIRKVLKRRRSAGISGIPIREK